MRGFGHIHPAVSLNGGFAQLPQPLLVEVDAVEQRAIRGRVLIKSARQVPCMVFKLIGLTLLLKAYPILEPKTR
jgi:hypothetical protein